MDKFDQLNRETREHNARNVDRYNESTRGSYTRYNDYWQSRYNNETYKNNNGTYTKKYY